MPPHLELVADIGSETVDRTAVLAWELERARKVLRLLEVPFEQSADVDALREQLLRAKVEIGPEQLEQRISGRLFASGTFMKVLGSLGGAKRKSSVTRIRSPQGTAEQFGEWFNQQAGLAYSKAMLAACPDHYLIGEDPKGQKVIETTGGSPLPTRFFIDYQDVSSLVTPPDPAFPVQIAGVARDEAGTPLGGVRHQFRNLESGFEAWLTVEFPACAPAHMLHMHRWHLACEFSNWIEFSLSGIHD